VATLLGAVVVVGLAWWLRSVWALIIGNLISAVITVGLSFAIQRQWPRPRFRLDIAKELYHYGKFVTAGSVVIFLALQMDNAVVGKLLGMKALGFYLVAYTLANLPATHMAYLVSNVMLPSYGQIQGDRERLRAVFLKVLRSSAALTIPAAAGLAFLAGDIVRVIYGPKWLPMVAALQVLCLHGLLRSIQTTTGPLFLAVGQPRYDFFVNALRVAVIALAIIPLTRALGIVGTAVSVSLAVGCAFLASFYLLRGVLQISWWTLWRQIYPSSAAALAMVVGLGLLRSAFPPAGLAWLLVFVLTGAVLYTAAVLVVDQGLLRELRDGLRRG
jgi:PST family polysaccharide transporter/lipopolysaccharide exporter